MLTYEYDSWGVPVSVIDNSGCNLSMLNPFRYRGYVYDDETGYYYLKSRYYDPESGRFLSADNEDLLSMDAKNLQQYNMYAYCYNSPMSLKDSMGEWPEWADTVVKIVSVGLVAVAAAFVCVATSGVAVAAAGIFLGTACSAVIGGSFNEMNGGSYTSGCIGGAVSGLTQGLCGLAGPQGVVVGGSIGSGLGTFVTETLENKYGDRYEKMPLEQVVNSSLKSSAVALGTSSLSGLVAAGTSAGNDKVAGALMKNYSSKFGLMVSSTFSAIDDACTYAILRQKYNFAKKARALNKRKKRRWKKR